MWRSLFVRTGFALTLAGRAGRPRSGRPLRAFALALLFVAAGAGPAAADEMPVSTDVTAGVFPFPPQYVLNANARPTGYAIDMLDAVARRAGLTVTYRAFGTLPEAVRALKSGAVDLIPNLGITASGSVAFEFSVPVETIPIMLFVRAATSGIATLDDLGSRPVAVVEHNVGVDLVKAQPAIAARVYPELSSALAALISGQADALIYPAPMLWKNAVDLGLGQLIKETGNPLREVKRAMTVRNGNRALLERLNPAIVQVVASREFREIRERWYGEAPPFWTAARVAWLLGGLLLAVAALGGAYQARNLRLNRRLLQIVAKRQEAEKEVLLRDSQLNQAHRIAQTGSWELDLLTHRLTWSDEIFRIFEIDPASFGATYEAFLAMIHPEERDAVNAAYRRSLETHESYEIAHRLLMPDGRIKHVNERCETKYSPDGKPLRSVGTVQDITAWVVAENAILESEAKYRTIVETAQEGVWVIDPHGKTTFANQRMADMLGDTVEGMLGRTMFDYMDDEGRRQAEDNLARRKAGISEQHDFRFRRRDGTELWTIMATNPICDAGGAVTGALGMVTDITARKRVEEVLRENEVRLKLVFDSTSDLKVLMRLEPDERLICEAVNKAYSERIGAAFPGVSMDIIGGERGELLATWGLTREQIEIELEYFRTAVRTRSVVRYEMPAPSSDDDMLLFDVSILPVVDGTGQCTHLLWSGYDITERKRVEEAVRESERRLEEAQRIAHVGSWEWDAATGISNWSRELCAMLEVDPNNPPPTLEEQASLYSLESMEKRRAAMKRAMTTGAPYEIELERVREGGPSSWLLVTGEVHHDMAGKMIGLRGTALDITERKRVEQELRESEGRLRRAESLARIGHYSHDVDGANLSLSDGMKMIVGWDPDSNATFDKAISQIHRDDVAAIMDKFVKAGEEGRDFDMEFRIVLRDGSATWVRAVGEYSPGEPGRPPRYFATMIDITSHKRNEATLTALAGELEQRVAERTEELAAAHNRLEYLLGSAPAVVYATPVDGSGASFVSENVARLLGYDTNEILAQADFLPAHLHPGDLERAKAEVERLPEQGRVSHEYRLRGKDGEYRWIRDEGHLVRDAAGQPREVVGVWMDVTNRVEAEQELARAREQLIVQQKMATVGQLTATVSHELRNPLGTIRTSTYSLKERLGRRDAGVVRTLERIERNVARCDNIITDLLDFSRTRPANPEPTAVVDWLRALVAEQECPPWLKVDFDLDAEGLVIALDQDRFRRAVVNVIENAVQAMEPQAAGEAGDPPGRLTVCCRREPERLVVTVADTGPGMPPEVLVRVFEPMFSTKAYGVGLGLPTVKQIMESEGGGIEIASEPGQGTQVVLWLPLAGRMSGVA